MEKIVIDKEFLKDYKFLLLGFENCDAYKIAIEDILDIYCKAEATDKKKSTYRTADGFIKIAARASQTVECFVSRDNLIGTKWDTRLKERLEMLGGAVDILSFSLEDKENHDIDICVPYDPLESVIHGDNEIELSNCPSLELDEDGNMIIAFGKSSKQPKRKDNNYAELITGWKDAFGENEPTVLKVKVNLLESFGEEQNNFTLSFKICNKFRKNYFTELIFMDCRDIVCELYFPEKGECEIVMSKMADGRIYVGLDGLGIEFICTSVLECGYYYNQNKD